MIDQHTSVTRPFSPLWWGLLLFLFCIPLVFSTSLYRGFEIPKAVLLRAGIAILLAGWVLRVSDIRLLSCGMPSDAARSLWLFLLAGVISTATSLDPILSTFGLYDRQMGLLSVTAAIIFCFLIGTIVSTDRSHKTMLALRVMTASSTLVAVYALLQVGGLDPIFWSAAFGTRPSSTLGHPDYLGELLAMTLPLGIGLSFAECRTYRRIGWITCSLIQGAGIIASQTRGAWITVALTVPALLLAKPFLLRRDRAGFRRQLRVSLLFLLLLAGLIGTPFLAHPGLRQRAATITRISEQTRLYLWQDTFKCIKGDPLLGSGLETFRIAFMPCKSITLARLEKNTNYDTPHNHYLHLWAVSGILGLLAFLYLLFCLFHAGIRVLKCPQSLPADISLSLIVSLSAYCIAMATGFDTITTLVYFSAVAGLLAARADGQSQVKGVPWYGWKRWLAVLITVLAAGWVILDSWRLVRADQCALAGLRARQSATAASIEDEQRLFRKATQTLPRESFYSLQAGVAALNAGSQHQVSKEYLKEAVTWGHRSLVHGWAPENSWSLISTAWLNLESWPEAEDAARRGLMLDPYNVPLLFNQAKALRHLNRLAEAVSALDVLLAIDPQFTPALELRRRLAVER
ncbi:MAG TPA: O-antigen ligase family protein [Thermodesulfobacteriota bacterium]|nr:O-antigen ligase family protein [Thermodesulfobacteriota bacterium]